MSGRSGDTREEEKRGRTVSSPEQVHRFPHQILRRPVGTVRTTRRLQLKTLYLIAE